MSATVVKPEVGRSGMGKRLRKFSTASGVKFDIIDRDGQGLLEGWVGRNRVWANNTLVHRSEQTVLTRFVICLVGVW